MWEVKNISSFLSSGRKILPSCNPSFNNSLYGVFLLQRVFQFMHADLAYKVLTESGLPQVLANFLRENYHPKLSNFGRSYFFTASLANIDTHIRSYLNPSIMKVNWEIFGPWNWILSKPTLQHTITKFAFCENQHFDTHTGVISIWMLQCGFLSLYHF